MKKKYLNKSIVALLLTVFLMIIVSTLYTGFMAVYADSQYTQDYTQLTDEELDDLSARTTESDEAPQITVFTHGFGGGAQHWSNDISAGGDGGFAYSNYNDNEELIQYPAGKADTSFTIPSSVGVIGTGAFVGSTNIRTVNLGNNVHRIGTGAFVDCSNLATIQNGNNVGFVEMGAFEGTEWIDSNENELSMLLSSDFLKPNRSNTSKASVPSTSLCVLQ